MAFVLTFKAIFGDDNTLIGVTTITAMLMFLSRDLTVSPLRNTLKLIGTASRWTLAFFVTISSRYGSRYRVLPFCLHG